MAAITTMGLTNYKGAEDPLNHHLIPEEGMHSIVRDTSSREPPAYRRMPVGKLLEDYEGRMMV